MKSAEALRWPARSSSLPDETPAATVPSRLTVDELVSGLTRLQRNIRNEADLDKFLGRLVEAARLLLGASGAAIALRDRRVYRWRARSGKIGPPIGAPLHPESGIAGGCLASGRVQYCPDTSSDVRVEAAHCRLLGLVSIAAVPVVRIGAIDGVLETWSSRVRAFDRPRLQLLQDLATLAAIVGKRAPSRRVPVVSQLASFLIQQASCNLTLIAMRQKWVPAAGEALRNARHFFREGFTIHPSSDNLIAMALRSEWAPAMSNALKNTKGFVRNMLFTVKRTPVHLPPQGSKLGRLGLPAIPVAFLLVLLPWAIWRGQGADNTLASISPTFQETRSLLAPLPVKTSLESPSTSSTRSVAPQPVSKARPVTRTSPLHWVPEDASQRPRMKAPGVPEGSVMNDDAVPPAISVVERGIASDHVAGLIGNLFSLRPDAPTLAISRGLPGGDRRNQLLPELELQQLGPVR